MSLLSHFTFKGRQELAATADNSAIAVTAGAGSGKTRTLTGRYLHLLEQGYPLRSIIAITFTEKAAREMRTRIRSELERWEVNSHLQQVGVSGDKEHRVGVRTDFDSARISTIHSLCAEILRSHPAEAGLDPAFSVLEGGLAAVLRAESVDAALAWAASDSEAARLFAQFKENELRRLLSDLIGRRLDLQPWLEQATGPCPLLTDLWYSALARWLAEQFTAPDWQDSLTDLAQLASPNPDDKLETARRTVLAHWGEACARINHQQWDLAFLSLAALRKAITSTGGSKPNWDAAELEAVRDAMRALSRYYDDHIKPLTAKSRWSLDEQAVDLLPALRQLIGQAFSEYEKRKDERQSLDFDDLEGRAAHLLSTHPAVSASWQSEIHAVLVDEFQDTNDRQRQIVYALSGFTPLNAALVHPFPHRRPNSAENDDTSMSSGGGIQRGGSIFIVGDAKQSIYKFRGADVNVFRQVQTDIAASGGLTVDLDLTFRAHKPLLDLLNPLLAPILGEVDPRRPHHIPFASLQADRLTSKIAQPPYIEFHIGLGEDADEARSAAANSLAERLHQIHKTEGFAWGDIALLFRTSTAFEIYEDAIERAAIPFITVAGRGFYNRPEIRDLMNALTAIADPTDDLALAGLLRSPAFALPDDDLYHLRFPASPPGRKVGSQGIWPALLASSNSQHQRAAVILSELHALAGRAPAAEVLKRFLDLTAYRALLTTVPGGGRMARNVDKLLADAHRSQLVGLGEFLEYVQTLRDVGLREGEAPVEAGGAVQLMTVHKSKGLEFPVVVIADAACEPMARASGALFDPALGLLPGLKDEDDNRPAIWRLAALNEADKDDSESRRLLYVAATRAKEKLLISGHSKLLKGGKLSLRGWLGDLGKVLGMDEAVVPEGSFEMLELAVLSCGGTPISWVVHSPASLRNLAIPWMEPASEPEPASDDLMPALIAPSPQKLDDRTREIDPTDRVWRVIPKARKPTGPAWVVGKLVHEALRHWRWPAGEDFLRPYALEAGLADEREIRATLHSARRLLERFHAHSLFAEIDAAERYHELQYVAADDRGVVDLLYRSDQGWVILDFKTDEVHSPAEARDLIRREGYDQQLQRYIDAVAAWLGVRPRGRLVFLQVGDEVHIFEEETWI